MPVPHPLLLSPRDLESIQSHGEACYPEECCGFLIGSAEGGATRVERILPAANTGGRSDRFTVPPETVLAVHKEARAAGLDVVGYYHSHPDHPARPSRLDRENAWPGYACLIVSVVGGQAVETRSWRFSAEEAVEQEVRA